jgi:hypothetical protein
MQDLETDHKISVPMVCGEYMRATGFFYSTGNKLYLITARHNCMPTKGAKLQSGKIDLSGGDTTDFFSTIDIYLRTDGGFVHKRTNIEQTPGVKQTSEIDIVAIPLDISPEEYGYHVWTEDEITTPQSGSDQIESIGYTGRGFPNPDIEYEIETYRNRMGQPVSLSLTNEFSKGDDLTKHGLMPTAFDSTFVGSDEAYNGLSGSPIVGENLIGIHSRNLQLPDGVFEANNMAESMPIVYTRADVLPELLNA